MKRIVGTTLVLGTAVVLAACSASDPGKPKPESTPTRTSATAGTGTTSTSTSGGPALDIAKYRTAQCDILKADQLSGLGQIRAPEATRTDAGPSCKYAGKDSLANSTYEIVFAVGNGAYEDVLANSKKAVFYEEVTVAGRKAVNADVYGQNRDCSTAISTGAKDSVLVAISVAKNDRTAAAEKPCALTERLGAIVVANLGG
ncbi:DUF3558 domain-containing protein [Actinosynnema sp. NPDC020468]|uniref:DUF3558 domain-containing protein n=1 Tax=Actinosynnema sp. NPDC020468 TaxID=3154488 RepID=UPI0033E50948